MADPVVDNGSGTDYTVSTKTLSNGSEVQQIEIVTAVENGAATEFGTTANPVKVDGSNVTQPVSAASLPLPSGASTSAKQDTEIASLASIDGKITAVNTGAVVVSSSALPSGAATSAKQDTGNNSLSSIDGKITAVNTGAVVVSSSALPSGAATAAKQPALGTAGTASADVITVQGIASMTPVKTDGSGVTQPVSGSVTANAGTNLNTSALALEAGGNLAAVAASASVLDDWDESDRAKVNPIVGQAGVAGGTGVVGATTQRVTLATDVALPAGANAIGKLAANSGVDIGDVTLNNGAADETNGVFATMSKPLALSTYAPTRFANLGANATLNVKSSAGNVFALYCNNENASERFIQLHNTATTPSGGATPLYTFRVPAGGDVLIGTDFFTTSGGHFSTGIAFGFSTTKDSYTAGAAGDHSTIVHYV